MGTVNVVTGPCRKGLSRAAGEGWQLHRHRARELWGKGLTRATFQGTSQTTRPGSSECGRGWQGPAAPSEDSQPAHLSLQCQHLHLCQSQWRQHPEPNSKGSK